MLLWEDDWEKKSEETEELYLHPNRSYNGTGILG